MSFVAVKARLVASLRGGLIGGCIGSEGGLYQSFGRSVDSRGVGSRIWRMSSSVQRLQKSLEV